MKNLEEILADVLIKHGSEETKEEILEAIREPEPEYQEPWAKVALEAMRLAVHQALEESAKLQDELRDAHFDNYDEDEIVYQGILSLKEKY